MSIFGGSFGDGKGPLAGLTGRTLDDGERSDIEGKVWLKGRERLLAGQFAVDAIPVYHDRLRCPVAHERGAERMRRWDPAEAREYAVPCPDCVVPADESDGLDSPRDVLDALGDDAPELALQAASRRDMASVDDSGD